MNPDYFDAAVSCWKHALTKSLQNSKDNNTPNNMKRVFLTVNA